MKYRVVPHGTTGRTPAEMFMGRRPTTLLYRIRPDLREEVDHRLQVRHKKRLETGLPPNFQIGDKVYVRFWYGMRRWRKGVVVAIAGPLSYDVRVDDYVHRRHASQLFHDRGEAVIDEELEKALDEAVTEGNSQEPVRAQAAPPLTLQQPQPLQPSTAPLSPPNASTKTESDVTPAPPATPQHEVQQRLQPLPQRERSTRIKHKPQRFEDEFSGLGSLKE